MYVIRPIEECDNAVLATIVWKNLERFHLYIPETAYFASGLDFLSTFYDAGTEKQGCFVVATFGGVVIAEIPRHQGLCGDTETVSG